MASRMLQQSGAPSRLPLSRRPSSRACCRALWRDSESSSSKHHRHEQAWPASPMSHLEVLVRRQLPAALAALAVSLCSGTASAAEQDAVASLQPAATVAVEQQQAAPLVPTGPVYDGARVISPDKEAALVEQLERLERETGWRVRAVLSFGADGRPSDDALRAAWKPDRRTVVVAFDLSNPNLINPIYLGDEVLHHVDHGAQEQRPVDGAERGEAAEEVTFKLRRPWWFELQGRYGNLFYVRDEGEQKAVLESLGAITQCLGAPEGCKVVPGLPADQYQLTLALSVSGGIVAGSVLRLDPTGPIKQRWQWLLVFFPLWGSLFVSFGLGPIVTRTSDLTPVLANTVAFAVAAAAPTVISNLLSPPAPPAPPPPPPPPTVRAGAGRDAASADVPPLQSDDA